MTIMLMMTMLWSKCCDNDQHFSSNMCKVYLSIGTLNERQERERDRRKINGFWLIFSAFIKMNGIASFRKVCIKKTKFVMRFIRSFYQSFPYAADICQTATNSCHQQTVQFTHTTIVAIKCSSQYGNNRNNGVLATQIICYAILRAVCL